MQQSEMEILLTTLGATAEVMGTQLQPAALMLMAEDLSEYPLSATLAAIKRCRRELNGRLTLAVILERVQAANGIPGTEEAWALMSRPEDDGGNHGADGRSDADRWSTLERWRSCRGKNGVQGSI